MPFPLKPLQLGAASLALGFLFSGCLHDNEIPSEVETTRRLFVAASDFQSGVLVSFDPETLNRGPDSLKIASDAVLRAGDKHLYVLERFGSDNILKYDPKNREVIYQKHLGDGWNPSDMVFDGSGTAYISLENHKSLLRWSEETGVITEELDLSEYRWKPDAGDTLPDPGVPHASSLTLRNDTLFVALQRRGVYPVLGGPSVIVLVNTDDFSVLDTLIAPGANAGSLWLDGSHLYLICAGAAENVTDGAIYRWDLRDGSVEEIFSETEWEGALSSMACLNGVCAGMQYKSWGDVGIRLWETSRSLPGKSLTGIANGFGGAVWDASVERLFVGERSTDASGILAFDSEGNRLEGKGKTPLPPSSMATMSF
jgi:hypothetical protein